MDAPPRYSRLVNELETVFGNSDEQQEGTDFEETPTTNDVRTENHYLGLNGPPRHNHFDMGRYVLCWTGLTTQFSSLTCGLCGCWYALLGVFGVANIILPYALLYPGDTGMNGLLTLYQMAGVSCLLLCTMWFFTLRFFYKNHPQRRLHDSNYRLPASVNTGPIVCFFLVTCGLFGCITMALVHDIVLGCLLFDPPVRCYLHPYVISLGSIMAVIMFTFLCLNCACYFHCVRRNAGNIC